MEEYTIKELEELVDQLIGMIVISEAEISRLMGLKEPTELEKQMLSYYKDESFELRQELNVVIENLKAATSKRL